MVYRTLASFFFKIQNKAFLYEILSFKLEKDNKIILLREEKSEYFYVKKLNENVLKDFA